MRAIVVSYAFTEATSVTLSPLMAISWPFTIRTSVGAMGAGGSGAGGAMGGSGAGERSND
jgi:uncharacterized membrane protein